MHSRVIMFCCLVHVIALFSSGFCLYFVLKIQVKSMFSSENKPLTSGQSTKNQLITIYPICPIRLLELAFNLSPSIQKTNCTNH